MTGDTAKFFVLFSTFPLKTVTLACTRVEITNSVKKNRI